MKLHINKIHDTHSVRSQLLRIFSGRHVSASGNQHLFHCQRAKTDAFARYESLEKADGLRVLPPP